MKLLERFAVTRRVDPGSVQAQAAQNEYGSAGHVSGPPFKSTPVPYQYTDGGRFPTNEEIILLRMRIKEGHELPFAHMSAVRKPSGGFVVFVLRGDDPVLIEDDDTLFPSDTLIGQLIVLAKKPIT